MGKAALLAAFRIVIVSFAAGLGFFLVLNWVKVGQGLGQDSLGDLGPSEDSIAHRKLGKIVVEDARSYFEATGRRDRVYCMVPTLYEEERLERWDALLETWGKDCDVIKFFVDPAEGVPEVYVAKGSDLRVDIVQVSMVRKPGAICMDQKPCRHIWEKVWRSWVYIYMKEMRKAEWFLKIDDDTYFIPSNLRRFVRERRMSPDDPHYFGYNIFLERRPYTLVSGVCTALSRASVARVGPRLMSMPSEYGSRENFPHSHGNCVDRDGATEERVMSVCLSEVGIFALDATEDGLSERVIPLRLRSILNFEHDANGWFAKMKPYFRGTGKECCSSTAWAFHGHKEAKKIRRMGTWITMTPEKIEKLRAKEEPYSSTIRMLNYVLTLKQKIAEDPFVY